MNFLKNKNWRHTGQLTIFLGMSTLVVISFIAFVVNVGLFVKAKINLQNAVDSAAYAGAAVQARQLTNIGYLNYELRNNYKEWMFKYYVFGNVGLEGTRGTESQIRSGSEPFRPCISKNSPSGGSIQYNPNDVMNFRTRQFRGADCRYYEPNVYDRFNVPSICVHFGSNNNICPIASLPGLPRFNTVGLPSISEQHETLLNKIVETKSSDCSDRTKINFATAILWTYGIGDASILKDVPQIGSERVGAWVRSIEIGLRMRNLERIVNQKPAPFVCRQVGSSPECANDISNFPGQENPLPYLERTSKAFWSAYRNLSGGSKKEGDQYDFSNSFRMREIPPNTVSVAEQSLSGFLINNDNSANFDKYYLDLKAVPINYSLFYTSFMTHTTEFPADPSIEQEGQCGSVKTSLPVPGYIFGFVKNPLVPTYYAVEGKANFIGLFYPFAKEDGITLKTYAAAKPFGGRIGPSLFDVAPKNLTSQEVSPRSDKTFSSNYLSAIVPRSSASGITGEDIVKGGYPVPFNDDFWSSPGDVVGGIPSASSKVRYSIPNLIYEFDNYPEIQNVGYSGGSVIHSLNQASNDKFAYTQLNNDGGSNIGLYNIDQYVKFHSNKVNADPSGAIYTSQELVQSIYNVRRPTRYDALNFMIPLADQGGNNSLNIDTNPYVALLPNALPEDNDTRRFRLYAPLYGEGTLFEGPAAAAKVVNEYINSLEESINTYLNSIKNLADSIRSFSNRGGDSYVDAANSLYPQDGNLNRNSPEFCSNTPLAAKFDKLFSTSPKGCGIKPLGEKVGEYFQSPPSQDPNFNTYYTSEIKEPSVGINKTELLTGYAPGKRQGADNDKTIGSPFTSSRFLGKRNSYSVKFIPIKNVLQGEEPYDSKIFLDPIKDGAKQYGEISTSFSDSMPMANPISSEEMTPYKGLLSF